jgi:hypothetical protein
MFRRWRCKPDVWMGQNWKLDLVRPHKFLRVTPKGCHELYGLFLQTKFVDSTLDAQAPNLMIGGR